MKLKVNAMLTEPKLIEHHKIFCVTEGKIVETMVTSNEKALIERLKHRAMGLTLGDTKLESGFRDFRVVLKDGSEVKVDILDICFSRPQAEKTLLNQEISKAINSTEDVVLVLNPVGVRGTVE